jgi:hypothetical protein
MMDRDPSSRINLEEIIEHEWIKEGQVLNRGALTKELDSRGRIVERIAENQNYHSEG